MWGAWNFFTSFTEENAELFSWLCTFILCAMLYLFVRLFLSDQRTSREVCSSPDCVRCSTYSRVSSLAAHRVQAFITKSGNDGGLQRIVSAVSAEEASYEFPHQQPNVLYMPGLEAQPVWGNVKKHVHILEGMYEDILEEYRLVQSLLTHTGEGWTRNNSSEGSWKTFHIINQGKLNVLNADKCPRLMEAIKSEYLCDSVMTDCVFGNVFFSMLYPGSRIGAHYGPTNIRIRCHLGLEHTNGWTLEVGSEVCTWSNGKCLLFDDSFLHSVRHETNGAVHPRAVLIIDLWHPDLSNQEKQALRAAYPSS